MHTCQVNVTNLAKFPKVSLGCLIECFINPFIISAVRFPFCCFLSCFLFDFQNQFFCPLFNHAVCFQRFQDPTSINAGAPSEVYGLRLAHLFKRFFPNLVVLKILPMLTKGLYTLYKKSGKHFHQKNFRKIFV